MALLDHTIKMSCTKKQVVVRLQHVLPAGKVRITDIDESKVFSVNCTVHSFYHTHDQVVCSVQFECLYIIDMNINICINICMYV